jgi:hypothetical protein
MQQNCASIPCECHIPLLAHFRNRPANLPCHICASALYRWPLRASTIHVGLSGIGLSKSSCTHRIPLPQSRSDQSGDGRSNVFGQARPAFCQQSQVRISGCWALRRERPTVRPSNSRELHKSWRVRHLWVLASRLIIPWSKVRILVGPLRNRVGDLANKVLHCAKLRRTLGKSALRRPTICPLNLTYLHEFLVGDNRIIRARSPRFSAIGFDGQVRQ